MAESWVRAHCGLEAAKAKKAAPAIHEGIMYLVNVIAPVPHGLGEITQPVVLDGLPAPEVHHRLDRTRDLAVPMSCSPTDALISLPQYAGPNKAQRTRSG